MDSVIYKNLSMWFQTTNKFIRLTDFLFKNRTQFTSEHVLTLFITVLTKCKSLSSKILGSKKKKVPF